MAEGLQAEALFFPHGTAECMTDMAHDSSGSRTGKLALLNNQFRQFAETFQELRLDGDTGVPGFEEEVKKLGEIAAKMMNGNLSSASQRKVPSPLFTSSPVGPSVTPKSRKYVPLNYSTEGSPSRGCFGTKEVPQGADGTRGVDASTVPALIEALSKMDGRRAPKPAKYDVTSGRPLETFLLEFEDYCSHSFCGSSSLWASELEEFLVGPIHEAFIALYSPGESYHVVRERLGHWFSEFKETIHEKMQKI